MPDNVGSNGIGYGVAYPVFWIDRYHPHSVKQHTAFAANSTAEVDAFHAAALKAGGTEMERPDCAGRITTPDLCSIRTVTTSRLFSVAIERVQELELNLDREARVTTDLQSFAVTEDQQAIRELA